MPFDAADVADLGLSPRRRGNHRLPGVYYRRQGPIPAQAGEPVPRFLRSRCARAYPRAGGGTPCYQVFELLAMSKSGTRIESRLTTLYEQNSICIYDFFWRFT